MSGGGLIHHYVESKNKSNARTIIIDPRYTDTAAVVKISGSHRPSTDAALVAGLAHT
ncbi:hypothetical protein OK016_01865 [Vibrio chagasii]|nr:hypothetical protein [Vibrio chagasii]